MTHLIGVGAGVGIVGVVGVVGVDHGAGMC